MEFSVAAGKTLLEAARENKVLVNAPCGGRGLCGGCLVRVIEPRDVRVSDEDRRLLTDEQLGQGFRLACRLRVESDLTVRMPREDEIPRAKLDILALEKAEMKHEGLVEKYLFHPGESSLENLYIPLKDALLTCLPPGSDTAGSELPLEVVDKFAGLILDGRDCMTLLVRDNRLAGVEPGDTTDGTYGAAVDIGTTTIALYLCDLESGEVLGGSARTNSQAAYGADVMSRIGCCREGSEWRDRLTRAVREDIDSLTRQACKAAGVDERRIYRWVLVGNTTMQHLFLGLDPSPLGHSPYLPLVSGPVGFDPATVGLACSSGFSEAVFLSTVAGHVGADIVAVALAAGLDRTEKLTLAIDLGTNGEIVLADSGGRMLCCSTAAGPAFEGAGLKMGMRAETGAIDAFRITDEGDTRCYVIGRGSSPEGICGSGLLDIVAELLRVGLIDKTGRLLPPGELPDEPVCRKLAGQLREGDSGQYSFVVSKADSGRAQEIILTQGDIRELQLAAGAISSGIEILLKIIGRTYGEIESVLLTGAFGHYLNPLSAVAVGLIRGVPLERINSIGNAAGLGARVALLSAEECRRSYRIAGRMEFVELATNPAWQEAFTEAMIFP
ncbi:MAG: ASKHA domain-containing protein [Gemmatimonadota bacterium]|nr:ASKHA domain-containing protein [Gemmatimonadota bacterium]